MKKSNLLLSLSLAACLGACSTITTGTTQPLTVETPYAEGAACSLTDSKGATWRVQETPQTVEVTKGDGPMTIACEKSGFKDGKTVMQEGFAGATLGNVILGGGIGIIVDAASGAAQEYPDKVSVWLEPKSFASTSEREKWFDAKAAYEESLVPASQKQQADETKSSGNFNK